MMSGKTRYYELGRFLKEDVLDAQADFNENYLKIDTQMAETAEIIKTIRDFNELIQNYIVPFENAVKNMKERLNLAEVHINENAADIRTAVEVANDALNGATQLKNYVEEWIASYNPPTETIEQVISMNTQASNKITELSSRISALESA